MWQAWLENKENQEGWENLEKEESLDHKESLDRWAHQEILDYRVPEEDRERSEGLVFPDLLERKEPRA